jgi:MYXO-CTERM domain-containing protein
VADTAVADALDTAPDDTGGGDAAIDTGDGAADATADTVRDTNPGGADTSINEPEPGSSGGCSAAPGAASWPAAGLGALLAVAVARRRRAIR